MNLRRFIVEHELLVGFGVFGITQMLADILADSTFRIYAALLRVIGIVAILALFLGARSSRKPIMVPLMLIEQSGREIERTKFEGFLKQTKLERTTKAIDVCSPVKREDLVLSIPSNLRNSKEDTEWEHTRRRLVQEWEQEIDKPLEKLSQGGNAGRCYHIRPNIVLPMAFAVGSAVGLRRSIVLYYSSTEGTYRPVIDLQQPRRLHEPPVREINGLRVLPEELEPPDEYGERLILHLIISDRHSPNFNTHPNHAEAVNVAIYYATSLPSNEDWLPYVQAFVWEAKRWINRFQQVELCLVCPDVVAFALGMAFARTPHIKVCHWFAGQYLPVLDLKSGEKSLAFN